MWIYVEYVYTYHICICNICTYAHAIVQYSYIYSGIIHPSQSLWAAKDHSSPAAAGEAGVSGVRQWRSEMPGRLFQ